MMALAVAVLVPAAASAQSFGSRTLRKGERGADVRALQRYLNGIALRTATTGYFGTSTQANVKRFERRFGLRRTGMVTPRDARVLRRAAATAATTATDASPAPLAGNGGATLDGGLPPGGKARLNADGTATAPADAPPEIQAVIAAGNRIAFKPYIYGGGHGKWNDRGYDCSGSVSYALHGGGLIASQEDSSSLESYGASGRGRWITIYANAGHVYMYVAGLRYDTSGASADGSRWHRSARPTGGYVVRHPRGF